MRLLRLHRLHLRQLLNLRPSLNLRRLPRLRQLHNPRQRLRPLLNLRRHQHLRQLHSPRLHRPLDLPQQLPLQRELRSRQMFRTNFCHQLCVV